MFGKRHSEKTKALIGAKSKGRKNPMEGSFQKEKSKDLIRQFRKTSCWINKNGKQKFIRRDTLIFWKDAGWKEGRN